MNKRNQLTQRQHHLLTRAIEDQLCKVADGTAEKRPWDEWARYFTPLLGHVVTIGNVTGVVVDTLKLKPGDFISNPRRPNRSPGNAELTARIEVLEARIATPEEIWQ